MEPVVIPAILVKNREDLLRRIASVSNLVKEIQIDIMDGVFVPNKTIGAESLHDLPETNARYEFHWMVKDPENWISKVPGNHMHLVHVETISSDKHLKTIQAAIRACGGQLGLALNPETPLDALLQLIPKATPQRILIMTVHPGFSGQKYLFEMGDKLKTLRRAYPNLDIEVDGGVNLETVRHAYSSGANILAAASAIFSTSDVQTAIVALTKTAKGAPL